MISASTSQRPVPDAGQQIFGSMEHEAHGGQFNHAGRALEGMKGSKDAVDPLRRHTIALQRDQIIRGLTDEFAGLDHELFLQYVHGATPARMPTWRTSSASATGLTR